MPVGAGRLGYWFVDRSPPLPDPDVPQPDFPNLGFEQGFNGWTIAATRIQMGGLSNLAGFPTPTDPDPTPWSSPGDAVTVSQTPTFRAYLDPSDKPPFGQTQSCHLVMGDPVYGVVNPAGSLLYGPAIYCNFFVTFNAGDSCSFDWRAEPGSDAYNLFAYMVEKDTGNYLTLLRSAGQNASSGTTWTTTSVVIPTTGNYKFVFVAGSWDSTFGTVIGGDMLIDNIQRIPL